jgi:GMP synthase-like glutamine amidotransferase
MTGKIGRLGILKTGQPPSASIPRFGTYPDMFRRLFGEDTYDYAVYAADQGELPADVNACDAWLITGSACGVYDGLPWIEDLMAFVREARDVPRIGVCFGHQLMAQALGGQVVKSPKGWGVGEHEYRVLSPEPWMDTQAPIRLPASHQDQVAERPPGAEVFAACDFTPFGALVWRDQPAISIQLHPEFEPAYAIALIESRRGDRYSDAEADRAVASYGRPDDRARVGAWLKAFLAGA